METKILHDMKETGAFRCSDNNGNVVAVVCRADLAQSPTQSAVTGSSNGYDAQLMDGMLKSIAPTVIIAISVKNSTPSL